jgi:hypothetical protein
MEYESIADPNRYLLPADLLTPARCGRVAQFESGVSSVATTNAAARLSKAKYGSDFGAGVADGAAAHCRIEFQNRRAVPTHHHRIFPPASIHRSIPEFRWSGPITAEVLGSFRIIDRPSGSFAMLAAIRRVWDKCEGGRTASLNQFRHPPDAVRENSTDVDKAVHFRGVVSFSLCEHKARDRLPVFAASCPH